MAHLPPYLKKGPRSQLSSPFGALRLGCFIRNELVSNAFKHAFPDGKSGKIQVHLDKKVDRYTILVKDTGVGFPADMDMGKTETLGLQLVNDLVKQIEGSLDIQSAGGTIFKISF